MLLRMPVTDVSDVNPQRLAKPKQDPSILHLIVARRVGHWGSSRDRHRS